ncbi:hypothetical protein L1987_08777 [Smallanthus sonchifolius]|uniref:Uncharacterized protein n=1 Tax=Smallanthus sonchifolius TaxID=185202 RepID=A0ACB9JPB4_9ASTR|nr:hypothetical protein L1987_08777 [Smallanthus sonchifolius]
MDHMMGLISQLQYQVNIQVSFVNLEDCFDYEGCANRFVDLQFVKMTTDGEGPSGTRNESEKENGEREKEDENKEDEPGKNDDDKNDQGNTGLSHSDSIDFKNGDDDDDETYVENTSTGQSFKTVYLTTEGQVLDDLEEDEYITDDHVGSSPLHPSNETTFQTPPVESSKEKLNQTEWFKACDPKLPKVILSLRFSYFGPTVCHACMKHSG